MTMSKKRNEPDPLKRNEPEPKLPGGRRRPSAKAARPKAIARRERLERMLIAHDLERAERPNVKLPADDYAILRQIALEGAISNALPSVRANAILYLARAPSTENLNLLADLARHGEDHLVRGHALLALGNSSLRLAAPLLVEGLTASEPFERAAAEKGLVALGERLGAPVVRAALIDERLRSVRERIDARLARGSKAAEPRRRLLTAEEPPK